SYSWSYPATKRQKLGITVRPISTASTRRLQGADYRFILADGARRPDSSGPIGVDHASQKSKREASHEKSYLATHHVWPATNPATPCGGSLAFDVWSTGLSAARAHRVTA